MSTARLALGCMRLSTERDRDDARSLATIWSALEAGIAAFDTARAYALDDGELGHNERLLARALGAHPKGSVARIVTKCGMRRPGGRYRPDGRAKSILEDAEASAEALGRVPDLLLLHAPDPRVPLGTSVRALEVAKERGLARSVGVSNVSRKQLEEAAYVARLSAVEVALGVSDDEAARGGVLSWCFERGVEVIAHSVLGGPSRARRLGRDAVLRAVAARHGVDAGVVVIGYLLAIHPRLTALFGARRPETAANAARALSVELGEDDLAALDARFAGLGAVRAAPAASPAPAAATADVVLVMGIAGAGKSTFTESLVARGHERLNRDELGGTLRGIARRLDERLASGATRVVLDNTYVTRASRADVVRVDHARGASVRCVFVDTPLPQAQVNVVLRMLARWGELLAADEIKRAARVDPNTLAPTALFRMARELEPPAEDEGFSSIEVVRFVRRADHAGGPGAAVAYELLADVGDAALDPVPRDVPVLVFAWQPPADAHGEVARVALRTGRTIELGACVHPAGPPVCWCRPPLPGLFLAFAHRRRISPGASTMVPASAAHRAMASTLGLRIAELSPSRRPR